MARPTQTRLPQSQGFGPDQGRSAPALGVVAPLNVHTGQSSAERLAASLGVALDAAAPVVLDKMQSRAADAAALGRAAGASNSVDAKRQAEDKNYAFGVKRAMVDRTIVDFKSRAREFYENEFDKSMGTEVLAQELDGIAKGMLGNYAGDADAARWMTPEVMQTVNAITGAHDTELATQFKEDRIASANALVRDAVENQTPFDPQDIMNRLRPVLGGKAANAAYVEMVGSLAVEMADPTLIDRLIPESWTGENGEKIPGPRSVDGLNSKLTQAAYYAGAARDDARQAATAQSKAEAEDAMLRADLDSMMGVPPMIALLEARAKGLPISASDFRAAVNFYEGTQDRIEDRGFDRNVFADMRIRIAEDPSSISGDEMRAWVRQNGSSNPQVRAELAQLLDRWSSARNSAENDKSPAFASDYKSILTAKYGVPSWETAEVKAAYASGLQMYVDALAQGKDAKAAFAEADAFLSGGVTTKPSEGKAPVDITADVKRFTSGKMAKADFRNKYPGADAPQFIRDLARKKEITNDEARAAILALLNQQ